MVDKIIIGWVQYKIMSEIISGNSLDLKSLEFRMSVSIVDDVDLLKQQNSEVLSKQQYDNEPIQEQFQDGSVQQQPKSISHLQLQQQILTKDYQDHLQIKIKEFIDKNTVDNFVLNNETSDVAMQSQIQRVLDFTQQEQVDNHVNKEGQGLTYPNQHIQFVQSKISYSKMPESITPLIYSKFIPQIKKRISRNYSAKLIIIKLKIAEARDAMQEIKRNVHFYSQTILEQSSNSLNDYYFKYVEFKSDYSMRLQQSLFIQKQDYHQLKYQYEILQAKEQALAVNVESQLIPQRQNQMAEELQTVKTQNKQLAKTLQEFLLQNGRLIKESEQFKKQISEIESKTIQIKQSNDKLYEYIFDLQQKVAFHDEDIIRISLQIKEKMENDFKISMDLMKVERQRQKRTSFQECNVLQLKNMQLKEQLQQYQNDIKIHKGHEERVKILQEQNVKLKEDVRNLQGQLQHTIKEIQMKNDMILEIEDKMQGQFIELANLRKNKESPPPRRKEEEYSRDRNDRNERGQKESIVKEYLQKQDKKAIEALQIQKMILQKQLLQLKAELQFQSKQPTETRRAYHTDPSYQTETKQYHFYNTADNNIPFSSGNINKYAQKDNSFQREPNRTSSKDYYAPNSYHHRNSEQVRHVPIQKINHNEYGMHNIALPHNRAASPTHRNHQKLYSNEAQIIIQKVRMRQKLKDGSFDLISRGSRQHSRDYNPPAPSSPYGYPRHSSPKKEMKSTKMKMIEQKVRRLKSQLKSSLQSMPN